MNIDSHQHFWKYNRREFGWINASMSALQRDFLPADLRPEIEACGIDGAISVQARQSLVETQWLLRLAEDNAFVCGVVGWVPLTAPDVGDILARLAANPNLKGVRHVLHDEPDDDYMLRPDFGTGIALLEALSLTYDVLIFERHLPQTLTLIDRHPDQVFVLDHIGKPRIRDGRLEPWRTNLGRLAERPNVFCKLSGVVTEDDPETWTEARILPYIETALETFGPSRLMFGSDWPVCLAAGTYGRWHEIVRGLASRLSKSEQADLFGATAARTYNLLSQ